MASQRTRRRAARTAPPPGTSSPATRETESADQALRILVRILARQAAREAVERERRLQRRPKSAITGSTLLLRPGLQRVMQDAMQHRFDVLLAESLDRTPRRASCGAALETTTHIESAKDQVEVVRRTTRARRKRGV